MAMLVGIPRDMCLWEDLSGFLDLLSNGRSICLLEMKDIDKAQSGGPTKPNISLPLCHCDDGTILLLRSKEATFIKLSSNEPSQLNPQGWLGHGGQESISG